MMISRDLVGGGAAAHQDAVAAGVLQRQPECERAGAPDDVCNRLREVRTDGEKQKGKTRNSCNWKTCRHQERRRLTREQGFGFLSTQSLDSILFLTSPIIK